MPIQKPDYQLTLKLDLEEPVSSDQSSVNSDQSPAVSPEEARLRSEAARSALDGRTDLKWMDEYRKLREGGWNWRVAAYIAWASSPHPRTPKSQDELAKQHLGLTSDRAITTWRNKNPAIDEMVITLQSAPLWDTRAKDFEVLNEGAEKAGQDYKFFKHLEMKMLMRQDYIPASKLTAEMLKSVSGRSLDDLSDEELAKLSGELGRRLQDKAEE